jgi:hypothetical protein
MMNLFAMQHLLPDHPPPSPANMTMSCRVMRGSPIAKCPFTRQSGLSHNWVVMLQFGWSLRRRMLRITPITTSFIRRSFRILTYAFSAGDAAGR